MRLNSVAALLTIVWAQAPIVRSKLFSNGEGLVSDYLSVLK